MVQAFAEAESKRVLSVELSINVRPFLRVLGVSLACMVQAFAEVESKGVFSAEALMNVRPFLHPMGNHPFEALSRLEILVRRIPAVKSVMELPGGGGRRRWGMIAAAVVSG